MMKCFVVKYTKITELLTFLYTNSIIIIISIEYRSYNTYEFHIKTIRLTRLDLNYIILRKITL